MTPADLASALNRERARTARLRTLLAHRNATIDGLTDALDQAHQDLKDHGVRPVITTPTLAARRESDLRELVDVLAQSLRRHAPEVATPFVTLAAQERKAS